ncbi:MAG: ABC transporter ATP-binding protein [Chloroflexi bacterium]|nr:ABC transporter ATP-binding protein [Chloroflexota bacterium]MCL5076457.1 ABC transporter ATP-binding protein [Chloroflexota bacterium]
MIEIKQLSFAYFPKVPLFEDFNWSVQQGEAWAVIGPSGCGKTTLLYLIAGLRSPNGGSIVVDGYRVIQPRASTGLILQDYGLLPWATAAENIALGLKIRKAPPRMWSDQTRDWLQRLGLEEVAKQYPAQLSGGQRQRVAIARTLAVNPDLLLMDEPFSSLDALTRESMQDLVIELGIEGNLTTILVTHNIEEAVFLGQKILVLPPPPIRTAKVINNPQAGELDYRGHPEFYAKCNKVRLEVERINDGQRR